MQRVFTKREKSIAFVTFGLIIFSIFFNFIILPVFKKNELLNKEILITRLKLEKSIKLVSQKDYIHKKYSQAAANMDLSSQEGNGLVTALAELENLAKQAEIKIVDIRPDTEPTAQDSYKELTINLKAEGSMEGYVKFLYSLENSLTLLKIRRFQLNSKPNSQNLEGSFTVSQISAA